MQSIRYPEQNLNFSSTYQFRNANPSQCCACHLFRFDLPHMANITSYNSVWNMDRSKWSKIWLHFRKEKAKYNAFGKLISYKSGCTSNLSKHLRQLRINLKDWMVFDVLQSSNSSVSWGSGSITSQAPPTEPGTVGHSTPLSLAIKVKLIEKKTDDSNNIFDGQLF